MEEPVLTPPHRSAVMAALARGLFAMLMASILSNCGLAPTLADHPADATTPTAAAERTPAPSPVRPQPPMPAAAALSPAPDLWTRFQRGRHWQPCELTPDVNRWIQRYAGKPERFAGTLAPVVPLMDYVLTRAEELDLPSEIMLVPIIESYYRPDARGPGGALGLWQLMPDTGRRFGLIGHGNQDDRLDVHASTEAALRLLKLNAEAFSNNPKLMFAAYNAGAYRLRKALAGRDQANMATLDGLGLSRTTREYIHKLKALGCLLGEPERFGLQLPDLAEGARLVEFRTPFAVDPSALSARAGIAAADLQRWNQRAFARSATDADRPFLLPASATAAAAEAISVGALPEVKPKPVAPRATATAASGRVHKVRSGDSLWTISKRYRVRLADLMRWNDLSKKSVLRIGQTLKVQGNS